MVSIEFAHNEDMLINAIVWQKYDKIKHKHISKDIFFPGAKREVKKLLFKKSNQKYDIYCWDVKLQLKKIINHNKYPLE